MQKYAILKISVSRFPEKASKEAAIVTSISKLTGAVSEDSEASKILSVDAKYWKPDTEIDYESFRRNGITPVDVGLEPDADGKTKSVPKFRKGVKEADEFMRDVEEADFIVAHSAEYVKSVLEHSGYDVSDKTFVDTLNIARNMYMLERNSLDAVVLDFRLYAYEGKIKEFMRRKGIEDYKLLSQSVSTGYLKRFLDGVMVEFDMDLDTLAKESEEMKFVPFGEHKGKSFEELNQKELSEVFFSLKEETGSLPEKILKVAKTKGFILKPYFKTGADAGKHIADPSVSDDKVKFLMEKSGNPLVKKYAAEEYAKRELIKKLKLVGSKKEKAHAMQGPEDVSRAFAVKNSMPGNR